MRAPLEILLVDDNPVERRIMIEALENGRVATRLHAVSNGFECMDFLRQEGAYKDAPRPGLILLDLNMPVKGGLDTLAEIKEDAELRAIPTVIVTSSKVESDIIRAHHLQANGFVVKPVDFDELTAVMGGIEEYWTGVVTLPQPSLASHA